MKKIKELSLENIIIENNTINLDSLTLKQKIAQMIMVRGDNKNNLLLNNLNIGGIFLDKQNSEVDYKNLIKKYQDNSKIKLFVATDLEGTWNPFSNFQSFPKLLDINTSEEAYDVGFKQGELLRRIGFNLNFAPIAEFSDNVYGGRAFRGTNQEVKEKLTNYIKGLQKNVASVCKHYPGKAMINNLHIKKDEQVISKKDLELFDTCFENNISGVMIGHQIVKGELDSDKRPSSVSKQVIDNIDNKFLIISDEINMAGVKRFYLFNKIGLYVDLINSGENLILDFMLNPRLAYKLIKKIEKEVEEGNIDEQKIDKSVKKILIAKGYKIK